MKIFTISFIENYKYIVILFLIYSCQPKNEKTENKYGFFHYEQYLDSNSTQILPFCKILVSEKFYKFLEDKTLNTDDRIRQALDSTATENLIIGIYIGGGERKVVVNEERHSSDVSIYNEIFMPSFYFYAFSNHANMFVAIVPDIPKEIISHEIKDSVLYAQINNYETGENKTSIISLHETKDSIIFSNKYRRIWMFNHSDKYIDISFLRDSVGCEFYNISHQYFYEILERFIQEKCGRKNELYFEQYLEKY